MDVLSNASFRTARMYSLVILVIGYVGLSFVWGHQDRLTTLVDARKAIAGVILASQNVEFPERGETSGDEGKKFLRYNWEPYFPALGEIDVNGDKVRIRRRGGGGWAVLISSPDRDAEGWIQSYNENINSLEDIAARIGIFASGGTDPSELYVQIEQRTLGIEVVVPGVGLGFRGMQVVWVCVIAIFGFLVILRDRIQHVLSDEDLAASERWLIIDGEVGIEYVLSQLWLVALAMAPIALSSGLIAGVTTQIAANGAMSNLAMDGLMAAGVLILLVGNGWLALIITSRILELRARRRELASS